LKRINIANKLVDLALREPMKFPLQKAPFNYSHHHYAKRRAQSRQRHVIFTEYYLRDDGNSSKSIIQLLPSLMQSTKVLQRFKNFIATSTNINVVVVVVYVVDVDVAILLPSHAERKLSMIQCQGSREEVP